MTSKLMRHNSHITSYNTNFTYNIGSYYHTQRMYLYLKIRYSLNIIAIYMMKKVRYIYSVDYEYLKLSNQNLALALAHTYF